MTIQNLTVSSPVVFTLTEYLHSMGVIIESGSDFVAYENALKDQPERGPIGPRFTPEAINSRRDRAFWIIGRSPGGEIIHTQAIRTIDLDGQSLACHLDYKIGDYISDVFDHDQLRYNPGPGAKSINGTVCYAGEFWMKGGDKGIRGKNLTTPLFRLTMAMSLLKWSPDYIFAVIRTETICKGLAARANFLHTEPGSIHSPLVEDGTEIEGWIAWVSKEDIEHLMKLTLNSRLQLPGAAKELKRKVA